MDTLNNINNTQFYLQELLPEALKNELMLKLQQLVEPLRSSILAKSIFDLDCDGEFKDTVLELAKTEVTNSVQKALVDYHINVKDDAAIHSRCMMLYSWTKKNRYLHFSRVKPRDNHLALYFNLTDKPIAASFRTEKMAQAEETTIVVGKALLLSERTDVVFFPEEDAQGYLLEMIFDCNGLFAGCRYPNSIIRLSEFCQT